MSCLISVKKLLSLCHLVDSLYIHLSSSNNLTVKKHMHNEDVFWSWVVIIVNAKSCECWQFPLQLISPEILGICDICTLTVSTAGAWETLKKSASRLPEYKDSTLHGMKFEVEVIMLENNTDLAAPYDLPFSSPGVCLTF